MLLSVLAALGASIGWATGIVLAEKPAKLLGAFEFTRIQLVSCSAILAMICSVMGYLPSLNPDMGSAFVASSLIGIILGNLLMIECLCRGGPRRTELLLALKAPMIAIMAFVWLREVPTSTDLIGAGITISGVVLAVMFGSNKASHSDVISGSLTAVIVIGLLATAFQGFGFLVMKPALLSGAEPLAVSAVRLLLAAMLVSLVAL